MDSDSDPGGFSNIDEINANTQPGWTPGVNTVYDRGTGAATQETAPTFIGPLDPVATTPDINLTSLTLDFGAVTVGMSDARTTTIENLGSADLVVTSLTITGSSDFGLGSATPATPFSIAAGSSVAVLVNYTPTAAGGDSGSLAIASNDPDEASVVVALAGTGVAPVVPCDIDINPLSLDFGSGEIGVTKTLSTSVGNTGGSPCEVTSLTVSGSDFSLGVSAPALPLMVQPGLTVNIPVAYTPSTAGSDTGMLSVGSNDTDEAVVVVALAGAGVPAPTCDIEVTPTTLDFGLTSIGSMMTRSAKVNNIGTGACTVDSLVVNGAGFALGGGAPALPLALLPQEFVMVSVNFAPSAEGVANGTLAIGSDDPAEPLVNVTLTGTGVLPSGTCDLQVDPLGLDFGTVAVGGSKMAAAALSNQGAGDCNVSSLSLSGSSDFALGAASPAAPFTLPAGASTMVPVDYTPSDLGNDAGALSIASNDPDTPTLSVNLTGNGASAPPCDINVDPLTLDFGAVAIGMTETRTAAATNGGGSDCTINTLSISGGADFTIGSTAPALPAVLAPGETLDIPVDYMPSDVGDDASTLQIGSNDPDEPSVAVSLTGTGVAPVSECDITVSPVSLSIDFGAVEIGLAMTQMTTIANSGTADCVVNWQLSPTSSPDFQSSSAGLLPPVTIVPGDIVAVSLDYAPSNVGDDSGALDISSNDPDEPLVTVALAGSGFEADGRTDLDITKLNAPREFRFAGSNGQSEGDDDAKGKGNGKSKGNGRTKDQNREDGKNESRGPRIGVRLLVTNNGSSGQSRPATLIGVQNGAEVYNQTIMVSAPPDGERKTMKFPAFVPTATGDIQWTATIHDDDPDVDIATATTKVGSGSSKDD